MQMYDESPHCPAEDADPNHRGHAYWTVYRFGWPWGLLFPKVERCLFCGGRQSRRQRRGRARFGRSIFSSFDETRSS